MYSKLLLTFLFVIYGVKCQEVKCPAGCFCDRRKGENLPNNQDGLRIHCVLMANDKFNPANLPNTTLQLDISKYDLKLIPKTFFSNVKYIEKVDLSSNKIVHIDDETFRYLAYLKTLDLSNNRIEIITTDTFSGLGKLEKLRMSGNQITTIEYGAFTHLANIQKIDLTENPLSCDCHLAWMLDWIDVAGAKARCSSPPSFENLMLKKLKVKDLTCDVPIIPTLSKSNAVFNFNIIPNKPQIAFEGDSLRLQCFVGVITNDILIRWFFNEKLLTSEEASITSLPPKKHQKNVGQQSHLFLSSLELEHSGNWTCSALVDTGEVQNHTVSVAVINHATVLCPSTVTNTSKGFYKWGVTMAGLSSTNSCLKSSDQKKSLVVEYSCETNGKWGILNDSQCAHTSDVTDKLYRFAYMNNSDFDQITLVQSARKLLEFTGHFDKFLDGMDIVYLSTVLENYVPYLSSNHELASLLVDIASNAMKMNPVIISQGQLFGHAATRLMATIANISRIVPAFQHHRSNLAVEGFKVSPRSFGGITCSWYSESLKGSARVFYCSENNKTVPSQGRSILGSVQLPSTLYYQLELLERDVNTAKNIMFTAFNNGTLFPQVSTKKDGLEHQYEVVSSCIMGSSVVAMEPFNLSEPVYVILKLRAEVVHHSDPTPAWWDSRANNGLGAWQADYCRMMKARRDSAVFSCHRLGYYALLGDLSGQGVRKKKPDGVIKPAHPAVYGGTIVAFVCLSSTIFVFTQMFTSINMTKKLKHSLPNFWLSVTFLMVFHVLGGEVSSDEDLCQSVGLLIHYFTLTSSLWLTISSSIIYRKLINPTDKPVRHINPYVVTPEEEVYIGVGDGKKYKKPMARFYLVGWGVPLIICGITGGASLSQYSSSGCCFLSLAPAAGAILVPIIISFLIHFFFLFAILTFSSNRVTSEGQNIYMSGYRADSQTSLCSQSTILVTDRENSHRSHGFALLTISILLLGIFFSAAMSIATPLSSVDEVTQHDIFGTLYAVLASTLGVTVVGYYCLLRRDILICKLPYGCSTPDETSNLVDLTAHKMSPNLPATKSTNLPIHNNFQPAMEQQSFQLVDLGGSVLGPSSGRLKQCNIDRESEGSSDYHSVNNAAHLRRPRHRVGGFTPPISAGVSEAETNKTMTNIIFGHSSKIKVNNVNIHVSEGPNKVPWIEGAGKGDWSVPQSQQSYYGHRAPLTSSPMELPYPDMALESSQLLLTNNGSFLTGDATVDEQDLQSQSTSYSSAYYGKTARSRDPLPVSASLPRRYGRNDKSRDRRKVSERRQISAYSDVERTEVCSISKFSEISSSTACSARSKGSNGRNKRNKPRRKPRKRSEIFPSSSITKRPNLNYDPILEVGTRVDDDKLDEVEMLATNKIDSESLVNNDLSEEENISTGVRHSNPQSSPNGLDEDDNSDEEESSDHTHLASQLASRELSNKETCV